eukprot:2509808-Rhodomonas_salina.1
MCDYTCASNGDCVDTGLQSGTEEVGYLFLTGDRVGFVSGGTVCPSCHSGQAYSIASSQPNAALQFLGRTVNVFTTYTLMIRLYMGGAPDGLDIFSVNDASEVAMVYKDQGKLFAYTQHALGQTTTLFSPHAFPLSTWVHVALVVSGSFMAMYEDGVMVTSISGRNLPYFSTGVDVKFMVNSGQGCAGTIADASMHGRGFSADEIDAVYSGRWYDTSSIVGVAYAQEHVFDLYACACNAGYSRNGVTCADVNECSTGTPCPEHSDCVNNAGGFSCPCWPQWSGADCSISDECAMTTHGCHVHSSCTDTVDSYTCLLYTSDAADDM